MSLAVPASIPFSADVRPGRERFLSRAFGGPGFFRELIGWSAMGAMPAVIKKAARTNRNGRQALAAPKPEDALEGRYCKSCGLPGEPHESLTECVDELRS